jgi:hypothetical protein
LRNRPPKKDPPENDGNSAAAGHGLAALFLNMNRGMLLDVTVFFVNAFLMHLLMQKFVIVIKQANDGIFAAQFALFAGCVGLFILPPAGATLKRWHFHRRRTKNKQKATELGGCFFNPIFYFCLTALIFSAVNAFIMQGLFGRRDPGAAIFISSIFIGLALMITHTYLVYRYFSPPKHEPRSAFLRGPRSELAGDICIFLNMLLFQLIWNLLTLVPFDRVSGLLDFAGRLFFLSFIALLIYFPPRMFYLADDIKRPRTWVFIMLANSPVIVKVMLGNPSGTSW